MFRFVFVAAMFLAAFAANAGVVATIGGAAEILVPVAGNVTGADGTPFRSDIRITNLLSRDQRVDLFWLPQNVTGSGISPIRITLGANDKLLSENFAADVMGQTGLGAIVVRAVNAAGDRDDAAKLDVTSRVWSPETNGRRGTTSQNLPTLSRVEIVNFHNVILGQKRDANFRTNVGIVNLDETTPQSYRITVTGDNPTLVPEVIETTVEPRSMKQIALQGDEQPGLRIDVEVLSIPPLGRGSFWASYGATVDNESGDAWSSIGFDIFDLRNQ
jgi:hypothetical protein